MPSKPKAVIFDFDGTLIDSSALIVATFNAVLLEFGLAPWSETRIRRGIGKPLIDLFQQVSPTGRPGCDELLAAYRRLSRLNGFGEVQLLPGVLEAVDHLRRNAVLGIATSRSYDSTREILEQLGLESHFAAIVGIDMVENPKPHPESVQRILHRFAVAPHQALLVGDTPDDVSAARLAGVSAVGVTTGAYDEHALRAAGAGRVIKSLVELLDPTL